MLLLLSVVKSSLEKQLKYSHCGDGRWVNLFFFIRESAFTGFDLMACSVVSFGDMKL